MQSHIIVLLIGLIAQDNGVYINPWIWTIFGISAFLNIVGITVKTIRENSKETK